MSYNANHKARTKDLQALATRIKAITDDLSERLDDLEELAESLLQVTNSVIANIQRGESA